MIEYIYKGFKLSYKIVAPENEKKTYKVNGFITYLLNIPHSFSPKKFYNEYATHSDAEHEMKQLLENHVNLELKHFYDNKKEPVISSS